MAAGSCCYYFAAKYLLNIKPVQKRKSSNVDFLEVSENFFHLIGASLGQCLYV